MSWLHAVIDVPAAHHSAQAKFWAEALGWPPGSPWPGHPELRSFEPPRGTSYVHLHEIDGSPRIHVHIESPDPEETASRAVELGAKLVAERERWRTLASPGGLPFCVLTAGDHEPPEPTAWPQGHQTRLVQVCVDSPVAAHDREVTFWRALLPGRWVESPARGVRRQVARRRGLAHPAPLSAARRTERARPGPPRSRHGRPRGRDRPASGRRRRRRPPRPWLARPARSRRPAVLRDRELPRTDPAAGPRLRIDARPP